MAEKTIEKVLEAVELAAKTGKIKKGANEVTKVVERGTAKLVVIAQDVTPKEITMHLPALCKEKNIKLFEVPKKDELGAAAGLPLATSAIAVIQEGEAKPVVKQLTETKLKNEKGKAS